MDIQEAKKIIEKGIKPEYKRLRQYDGYKYTGGWLEAIETVLSELDKKNKIIDKLLTEITAVNSGRYEYMDNNRVLEIFTNKVEEDIKE